MREPTANEVFETEAFVIRTSPSVAGVVRLVAAYQPGARLRSLSGMNVSVGDHEPPPGGSNIRLGLAILLKRMASGYLSPYEGHAAYETLHPFTDGNGRSGRALWLWHMGGIERAPLGFLHHWYYQSLSNSNDELSK